MVFSRKQIQPRHAKMHAVDRPVVKPRDAQRAPVAHAFGDDFPGVSQIIAILPNDFEHVAKMLRLGLAESKRNGRPQTVSKRFLDAMLHA